MSSGNSKTSDPNRLLLNLSHKINLKWKDRYVALSNLGMCYTWKNIKELYKNNTFKVSPPMCNDRFWISDGSYSVSDIQDYFEHIIKKHETVKDYPPRKTYANKKEKRITINTKTGYHFQLLTPEAMKLLGCTKNNKNIMKIMKIFLIYNLPK